jgi:hypothetical protein
VKIGREHGLGAEKPRFGAANWLAKPRDGEIITKVTGKNQIDTMNTKSNGKSRFKWEIPVKDQQLA